MAIVRWDPFREMSDFNRMVNRVFGAGRQEGWMPSVDVYDEGDHIKVKADLPGIDPKQIEVDLQDNVLSIKGRREEERRVEQGGYYRVEREFGEFQRSVTLPTDVTTENVEASYDNGVLSVRIPKTEQKKPQRIEVRAGEGEQQVTTGQTQEHRAA
jgi:HSP20 family protein